LAARQIRSPGRAGQSVEVLEARQWPELIARLRAIENRVVPTFAGGRAAP
jgi:hypothetical protein